MPGCVFRVNGDDKAVNEFLTSTSLVPLHVWHAGDTRNRKGLVCESSGFCVDVSSSDGSLQAQVPDAIDFLLHHQAELGRLSAVSGINDRRLDFGYGRREAVVQCDYLPPSLLSLAGALGIGIELSLYPTDD